MPSLGQTVRRLRQARKMTQVTLAQKAGISQGLVSRLEAGHLEDVSFTTALRLAKALEVPVERLAK